jgi:hypothetical protein
MFATYVGSWEVSGSGGSGFIDTRYKFDKFVRFRDVNDQAMCCLFGACHVDQRSK